MSLILDLPPPINEELAQDSQREGVSEREHAALLVCLASALNQEKAYTPFQKAVKVFLSHRALDAEQVFSVFEELVRVCLEAHDAGKTTADFQYALLKHWRNASVHQQADAFYDSLASQIPATDTLTQVQGRVSRGAAAEEEENDPRVRVHALLTQWQAEDNTPFRPAVLMKSGETPTQALFRKWAEEDARMTEEEKAAEDQLWKDIEQGREQNRLMLGFRRPAS